MAFSTTPHTESQQNANPARPDLEPDQRERTEGRQTGGDVERIHAGEQSGTNRAPEHFSPVTDNLNIAPADAAHEGDLSTRTPGGSTQGITSRSSEEESSRQEKVVKDRPDAQAGVNHNR